MAWLFFFLSPVILGTLFLICALLNIDPGGLLTNWIPNWLGSGIALTMGVLFVISLLLWVIGLFLRPEHWWHQNCANKVTLDHFVMVRIHARQQIEYQGFT